MTEELTNSYIVKELNKLEDEINIRIQKWDELLWITKISKLQATAKELKEYKD